MTDALPTTDFTLPHHLSVVDSHTAGEPTRCVLTGVPDLGKGSLAEQLEVLRSNYDFYRRAILCEPRGSDVLVGAYLVEPHDSTCAAGVIFFNNSGYLGMCGHGMIGVAVTLAHLGRIGVGEHRIDTPVGVVTIELHDNNRVSIRNVAAYRYRRSVSVDVEGYGRVHGDVAWGGNWFFLTGDNRLALNIDQVEPLTDFAWAIRRGLARAGITGVASAEIDHIELYAPAVNPVHDSRNFVLCPGKAYDRSPCGTGTSAKLACLAADGVLTPGQLWRQEGILGTVFEASFAWEQVGIDAARQAEVPQVRSSERSILPTISGHAYVTAEATLLFDADDPFRQGIGS
jgi:4-hydroxyproline epimerase